MKKEHPQKLQPTKFAASITIILSASVFLATILAIINPSIPTITSFILTLYGPLGYTISTTGSLLGALYIGIDTFILTWLFAWIYNKLL